MSDRLRRAHPPNEYAIVVGVVLIWGSAPAVGKTVLSELTTAQLALARPAFACIALLALAVVGGQWRSFGQQLRTRPAELFILGLVGYAGGGILPAFSLSYLPAGIFGILSNTGVLMLVIGSCVYRRHISAFALVGTGLGFVGITLLSWSAVGPADSIEFALIGSALAIATGACGASYTALSTRLVGSNPLVTNAIASGFGAALVAVYAVPGQDWTLVTRASWTTLVAAFWIGAVATGAAYAAWSFTLRRLTVSVAAPFIYLSPVVSLVIASTVLHEPVTPAIVAGGVLVLVGLAVSQMQSPPINPAHVGRRRVAS